MNLKWFVGYLLTKDQIMISQSLFDEDVIKTYDEFDRAEKAALGPKPEKLGKVASS